MAILVDGQCSSCGRQHQYCQPDVDSLVARRFTYRCPNTGETGVLTVGSETYFEVLSQSPHGAVTIEPF